MIPPAPREGDHGGPGSAGTVSLRELLDEASVLLARRPGHPDASPESDARRIVEEASGMPAAELAMSLDDPVTEGGKARFDSMLARRVSGEPLQYVLGHWGFRQLDLMVDRRVLIPRPETESVVDVCLAELDRLGVAETPTIVVDLGTGSGAIALAIATERVRTLVWASDASDDALDVARANLAGVGRGAARVTVVAGDWFEALPTDLRGSVQVLVSNPPYVADSADLPGEVADWEPTSALRAGVDGLDDLRRIIDGAPDWLVAEGVLVCEISPEQAEMVTELASQCFSEVRVEPDLTGRSRALVARRPSKH